MAFGRQVQLRQGSETLDLNTSTYILQADGWQSSETKITFVVLVKGSTLTEIERAVAPIYRMVTRAELYESSLAGLPVYLYSKSCDALTTTAELGDTWRRRRVRRGMVQVQPFRDTAATPSSLVRIELEVDGIWQRVQPAPVLEASATVTTRSDGGVSATASGVAVGLYAWRIGWTSSTGLTARWFWSYASTGTDVVNFLKLSANFALYWSGSASRFYLVDNGGTTRAQSGAQAFSAGQVVEVTLSITTSSAILYINGTQAFSYLGTVTWPSNPDTYRIWEATGSCTAAVLSVQIWPTNLSGTDMAGLASWGRPEPQLAWTLAPTDDKATNAVYPLYNLPGHDLAPLRAILHSSGSQDYARVLAAVRSLRAPTCKYECESGTLGTNTASNANADASGGSQARFTPGDTVFATRVTLTLAANPTNVASIVGDHRLYLAGYDSAASVQVNTIRWRLVVAGVAGSWSDTVAFAAVATRSLLDLGTVSIPPGVWPDESLAATTTGYGSAYVKLEIQACNSVGASGGTLDLDCVYLAPAEQENSLLATLDVSDVDLLLDATTTPPLAITIQDSRSLEFGGWGDGLNDLVAPPIAGTSGQLWLYWLRSAAEQAYPNDTCDVWLFYAPRWR